MIIRRANLADSAAIHRVRMASIRSLARTHYSSEQIEAWCGRRSAESYSEPIEHKFVLVAIAEQLVQGFAQLDAAACSIDRVYVAPESKRQGIGSCMLRALEAEADALGIIELKVDSSLNAVAFYTQAGYSSGNEVIHQLERSVFIPCVAMRKTLIASSGA